jgi:hypothetical protein
LNIISGANDSGKSNILRALNLFFNKQTNPNQFFDFEKDFFKKDVIDENEIKEELVTIKLWFNNYKNAKKNSEQNSTIFLPEKFWVSRKWKKSTEFSQFDQLSSIEKDFEDEKGGSFKLFLDGNELKSNVRASLQKQLTDFINSIQYHYIPAIKDSTYFAHLYGELQQTLWKTKKSIVEIKKIDFEKAIQEETNELMMEYKNSLDFNSGNSSSDITPIFQLPSDLINLFRALVVQTGEVDLTLRGDGYQAKLIPEILNFIAIKELSFTSKSIKTKYKAKKYFIWGFEEPENSYEYINAQKLAERFKHLYCKNAQIFITTHSFNFLSLRGSDISVYRVWKDHATKGSKISKVKFDTQGKIRFDNNALKSDWDTLQDELGFFYLNEELNLLYIEKERHLQFLKDKAHEINKPIIYSEGGNFKFIEKAKPLFMPDVQVDIKDVGGRSDLRKIFMMFAKTGYDRHKVFFVFDCDAIEDFNACNAEKTACLIPYIFKKNPNNTIPEIQKGIENLFHEDLFSLKDEAYFFSIDEHRKDGVIKSRTRSLRKKAFEKFILEERDEDSDFTAFKDLFAKIRDQLGR